MHRRVLPSPRKTTTSSSQALARRSLGNKSWKKNTFWWYCMLAAFLVTSATIIHSSNKKLSPHITDEGELLHLGQGPNNDVDKLLRDKSQSSNNGPHSRDNIKSVLQQRFDNLPPAPWPQLDHRIPKAILDGDFVGFDGKLSPSSFHQSNTIVTAYYEFRSKHTVRKYEKWFERILQASEPMIIFVEPGSKWFQFVKERRTHAPTIVAHLSFDDTIMATTFTEEFWNFMHSIDLEAKVHRGSGVYKIWNEKLIYMYAAIKLNPFNTKGFAWMDAGYFRQRRDGPAASSPIIKVNITEAGVPEDKLLLLHVRNDGLQSPSRVNIAGNSFVGTDVAFLEFYPLYFKTFYHWISIKKFIGSDQFVITEACRRYRSNCHPFFPGKFKEWFAMSHALAGKIDFSKVSPHFLFLNEPPTDVPNVPTGKRVSYCNGEVVAWDIDQTSC